MSGYNRNAHQLATSIDVCFLPRQRQRQQEESADIELGGMDCAVRGAKPNGGVRFFYPLLASLFI
jgi:hypothetical protein